MPGYSGLSAAPSIFDLNPLETNTGDPVHKLGELAILPDGRMFRYAKVGASGITAGKLQLAPAPKTNHHNIAVQTATAVGDTQITVTLGATAATANEYAEGFLVFSDVAPEGISAKISSHPAANASATLTLTLDDQLPEVTTTSSEVSLVHNTWNAVVEAAVQTRVPAGVPLVDMATGDFGWLQTRGMAPVLADETIAVGAEATIGSSTAGAVETRDAYAEAEVGWAVVAGVDGEYRPVYLTID